MVRLSTLVDGLCSALEAIEKQSRELLEKAESSRFMDKVALLLDKNRDSRGVAKLVEQLQDAITRYQVSEHWFFASNMTYIAGQVSQQQAIYERITSVAVRIL